MKRIALFLMFCASGFAAGTVTVKLAQLGGPLASPFVLTYSWTGDASTGSVPGKASSILVQQAQLQGYLIYQVTVTPGSTSPTAGYAITLKTDPGVDVLGGAASSLSATVAANFLVNPPVVLNGDLTMAVTGNSVASATGTVDVYLIPSSQYVPSNGLIFVTVAPAGACSNPTPLQFDTLTGVLYGCNNGTWGSTASGSPMTWPAAPDRKSVV